jgi:hypothetical protein
MNVTRISELDKIEMPKEEQQIASNPTPPTTLPNVSEYESLAILLVISMVVLYPDTMKYIGISNPRIMYASQAIIIVGAYGIIKFLLSEQ